MNAGTIKTNTRAYVFSILRKHNLFQTLKLI